MHGDCNLFGTPLAQVEIVCVDGHGTPTTLLWDLPLGHGEEFQEAIDGAPHGLTDGLTDYMYNATEYDAEDGYLLTARGNRCGHMAKRGAKVILDSASGLDFEVPVLRQIALDETWKNLKSKVAMSAVGQHMESMECCAWHAGWAAVLRPPQHGRLLRGRCAGRS